MCHMLHEVQQYVMSHIELNVSYVTWSSTICHSNIELNVSYVT